MSKVLDLLFNAMFVNAAAKAASYAAPSSHPNSIKIPCWTEKGALQDYLYVIVGYRKGFSGKKCYDLLPPAIKTRHEQHERDVANKIQEMPKYGTEFLDQKKWYTYFLTRPSSVWLSCDTKNTAMDDYVRVVLNYNDYSGWGCYRYLEDDIKILHEQYVKDVSKLLFNSNSPKKSGGSKGYRYYYYYNYPHIIAPIN